MSELSDTVNALRAYQQADEDGVIVKVSRQACDEAADAIDSLRSQVEELKHWDVRELGKEARETGLVIAHEDGFAVMTREAAEALPLRAQAAEARAEAEKRRADGHELALRQFIQLARAQGIEITHFECRPDDAALSEKRET